MAEKEHGSPEKEGIKVRRLEPDARGGDTYQVIMDIEASPDECLDAICDFKTIPKTSSYITDAKIVSLDESSVIVDLKLNLSPGIFRYRYEIDRKNSKAKFWMSDYIGSDDNPWVAIDVDYVVRVFGRFCRVILTENYHMKEGTPERDSTELFRKVGEDILKRIKLRREL